MAEKVGFFEEGNEFAKAIMTRTPLRRIAGRNVCLEKKNTQNILNIYELDMNKKNIQSFKKEKDSILKLNI